ncbi:hypothetical protein QWZ08_25040 [Ferruginibacter paludis]|uniref:hypothetical protein n=1 Tax=Ferruginibacter paludis TaxID=1310417 RepID=UPI0025B40436|nr:hypothetical protein [Ferruginibacter paludis]MDN3658934.1 hypothetical protein [Ferruginibacter paludis]
MFEKLALLSDNFNKYLTSLSLIAVIYAASFSEFFIRPYNQEIFEEKKELSRITAHRWKLDQVRQDLLTQLGDTSIIEHRYYFTTSVDTVVSKDSALQANKYFFTAKLDSAKKPIVDSLNKVYYEILIDKSDISSYNEHFAHLHTNILIREKSMWAIGFFGFVLFIYGMFVWYRAQKNADNKLSQEKLLVEIKLPDGTQLNTPVIATNSGT